MRFHRLDHRTVMQLGNLGNLCFIPHSRIASMSPKHCDSRLTARCPTRNCPAQGDSWQRRRRSPDPGFGPVTRPLLIEGVPGVGKTTLGQALARLLIAAFNGCSSPATCCPRMCWAFPSTRRWSSSLNSSADRFSPTFCWPTRSTGPRPRRNRRCWRR